MRLSLLLFTAMLAAAPAWAQVGPASSAGEPASAPQDYSLPISLDKIRGQLDQPPAPVLRGLNVVPNFRVEVQEKQKIEELVAAVLKDVKKVPVPAGGIYMQEMQRQWWPAVDNPEMQPYGAFNQGQLGTILAQNIAIGLLASVAMRGLSALERAAAEHNAREEVRQAILQYCAMQPDHGAAIQICRP